MTPGQAAFMAWRTIGNDDESGWRRIGIDGRKEWERIAQAAIAAASPTTDDEPNTTCAGEWIDGSGGHRTHRGTCDKPAVYGRDSMFAYCEDHVAPHEREQERRAIEWDKEPCVVPPMYDAVCRLGTIGCSTHNRRKESGAPPPTVREAAHTTKQVSRGSIRYVRDGQVRIRDSEGRDVPESAREAETCTCVNPHGIDERGACSVCKKLRIILSKPRTP